MQGRQSRSLYPLVDVLNGEEEGEKCYTEGTMDSSSWLAEARQALESAENSGSLNDGDDDGDDHCSDGDVEERMEGRHMSAGVWPNAVPETYLGKEGGYDGDDDAPNVVGFDDDDVADIDYDVPDIDGDATDSQSDIPGFDGGGPRERNGDEDVTEQGRDRSGGRMEGSRGEGSGGYATAPRPKNLLEMRLSRRIARTGIASRREAER